MFAYLTALLALAAHDVSAAPAHGKVSRSEDPFIRTLYQYPVGTWLENIAVRPSGELLLTVATTPQLDQLDPFQANSTPQTIHSFADDAHRTSVFGIAEVANDSFAVVVGNFSLTDGSTPGSWGLWGVDLSGGEAAVRQIADVPAAGFLNGLCALPSTTGESNVLLSSDLRAGVIYGVDVATGSSAVAVNVSLTAPATDPWFGAVGVNGVHAQTEEDGVTALYFANTGQGVFARVPVSADSGAAEAAAAVVVARAWNASAAQQEFDDFALRGGDAYLVTGAGNTVERVGLADGAHKGRVAVVLAGGLNSTALAEPTACAFGRTDADRHVLYVVTSGGLAAPVDGTVTVGAQVVAVDTSRWEENCEYI